MKKVNLHHLFLNCYLPHHRHHCQKIILNQMILNLDLFELIMEFSFAFDRFFWKLISMGRPFLLVISSTIFSYQDRWWELSHRQGNRLSTNVLRKVVIHEDLGVDCGHKLEVAESRLILAWGSSYQWKVVQSPVSVLFLDPFLCSILFSFLRENIVELYPDMHVKARYALLRCQSLATFEINLSAQCPDSLSIDRSSWSFCQDILSLSLANLVTSS